MNENVPNPDYISAPFKLLGVRTLECVMKLINNNAQTFNAIEVVLVKDNAGLYQYIIKSTE